jgi:DNA (cytosine-5)-methyltransferase 1
LYCCAGGGAVGYNRAGFEVVGVDIEPQPSYPFTFHQGDAIEYAKENGHLFDAIHASPPCQDNIPITAANRLRPGWIDTHVNLIPDTRAALALFNVPTVIENGLTTRLRADVTLCGLMFKLPTFRHRLFELNRWTATAPKHPSHKGYRTDGWRHGVKYRGNVYGVYGSGGGKPTIAQAQTALGIDWTDKRVELNEAIPPAYTEHIGRQLMEALR